MKKDWQGDLLMDRLTLLRRNLAFEAKDMPPEYEASTDPDNYTYRVSIDGRTIRIICFGIPTIDVDCEGEYDGADALPDWVQDRLAILMMTPNDKPTADIRSIGRRISKDVFWIYAPKPSSEDKSRA